MVRSPLNQVGLEASVRDLKDNLLTFSQCRVCPEIGGGSCERRRTINQLHCDCGEKYVDKHFIESESWMNERKARCGITSRKIAKVVITVLQKTRDQIEKYSEEFGTAAHQVMRTNPVSK
ncbi:hypothetical protein B9Z55_025982 [Caenorhabditis nigoni]|uniref:Uncharacterized protein n=1 Tax=Caenorhabditis nigoni TaxID=1611254 RepID=A0A2G5T1A0_9PELO|nr:hypothetical protein B9Z55_025982 [Caenorhabditis nigoni]